MDWTCQHCTFINNKLSRVCDACERVPVQSVHLTCERCTFVNEIINDLSTLTNCKLCGNEILSQSSYSEKSSVLSAALKSSSPIGPSVENFKQFDDDDYFKLATLYFEKFVHTENSIPTSYPGTKQIFRCKLDQKVLHSKKVMIAYLTKNHTSSLKEMSHQRSPASLLTYECNSGIAAAANTIGLNALVEDIDEALALQIAMDDYDKHDSNHSYKSSRKMGQNDEDCLHRVGQRCVHDKGSTTIGGRSKILPPERNTKNSSTNRKRGVAFRLIKEQQSSTSESDGDREDKKPIENIKSDGEAKSARLQKLLRRSDKLVENVNTVMRMMMQRHCIVESDKDASKSVLFADALKPIGAVRSSSHLKINLREYQVGGVEWMISLYATSLNGILADEMGLGKTLQVLSFLLTLHERYAANGPHLVVMPLSVMNSWKGDLAKFITSDIFDVYTHYGEKSARETSFSEWLTRLGRSNNNGRIYLVLTTYEIAINDGHLLRRLQNGKHKWEYLVVDEAHRLKNKSAVLFDQLRRLQAKHRLLLTGTPLQNNLNELWALLSFILPGLFNDEQQFSDWFNRPFESDSEGSDVEQNTSVEVLPFIREHLDINDKEAEMKRLVETVSQYAVRGSTSKKSVSDKRKKRYRRSSSHFPSSSTAISNILTDSEKSIIVSSLHRVMKPFILRRLKSEVIAELPMQIERVVICPLLSLQTELHNVFRRVVEAQESGSLKDKRAATFTFNNLLMQLRKTCNHPYLVLEDIRTIPDDLYDAHLIGSSGKLFVLEKLLSHLLSSGSKVLIFSQMTTMLDILQGFLFSLNIACCRLDGDTKREDRDTQISSFNRSLSHCGISSAKPSEGVEDSEGDSPSVFLLSTRAGGVGLNLQAADTVILFDSDWNPQQDLQAIARAHRIGQTRTVLVLRFISAGPDEFTYSVEQKILKKANKKLDAGRQILAKGQFDMGTTVIPSEDNDNMSSTYVDGSKNEVGNLSLLFEKKHQSDHEQDNRSSNSHDSTTEDSSMLYPNIDIVDNMDFSSEGIRKICCRESSDNNKVIQIEGNKRTKNSCIPYQNDSNVWKEWLMKIDPLHHNLDSDDFRDENTTLDAFDGEYWSNTEGLLQSERSRSCKKRVNLNEQLIWKQLSMDAKETMREQQKTEKQLRRSKHEVRVKGVTKNRGISKDENNLTSDEVNAESVEGEDICTLCGSAWIWEKESDDFDGGNDMLDVMILCDGCDGSYHMICAGLEDIPPGDWYCNWCVESLK